MKKLLLFVFLIQSNSFFSQTLLATFPLELKKSKDYHQILNAENTDTHEVFAFITDKETLTILKFNSALFLTNHFTLPKPETAYKVMAGYSFNNNGDPTLYWSNSDYTKIMAVQYDMNSKTNIVGNSYNQQFIDQNIISQFQANNSFYILTKKHYEQELALYTFKDGNKDEKKLDFRSFKFKNSKNQKVTFSRILEVCPIEKIETNQFNPLSKGTEKTKLYVLKNKLLLTLDHNDSRTQAFEIDLITSKIQEKIVPKTENKKYFCQSNSYYHEGKIYQVKVSTEELLFEIKDYNSGEQLKKFLVNRNETIPFRTSPLWFQREGESPREIKKTGTFLNQLSNLDVGLTVYKTPKYILITMGATGNNLNSFANILSQIMDLDDIINPNMPSMIYFESVYDKKLDNNKQGQQDPLAIDFMSHFIQEHKEVTLTSIFRYNNYYIMGYYDTNAKQYTMRKFIDGFER